MTAALVACLVIAVAAVAAQSRLLPGVPHALFAAAVSFGVILVSSVVFEGMSASTGLTLLAVGWFLLGGWIEHSKDAATGVRRLVGRWEGGLVLRAAGLVCGLLALGGYVPGDGIVQPGALIRTVMLFIGAAFLALLLMLRGGSSEARENNGQYPGAGEFCAILVLAGVLAAALHKLVTAELWSFLVFGQSASAAVAIALVLVDAQRERRHRQRVWLAEPRRLLERTPPNRTVDYLVISLAWGVGVMAAALPTPGISGVSLILAAMSSGAVFHRRGIGPAGDLALLLCAESAVLSAWEWTGSAPAGALLGGAVAAVLMTGMGTVWSGQLHEGRAWTSAGRLVPATRRVTCAVAALMFMVAFSEAFGWSGVGFSRAHLPLQLTVGVACLGLAWLLSQVDGREAPEAELGSALAICAAMLAIWSGIEGAARVGFSPVVAIGAGLSLLALCLAVPLGRRQPGPIATGLICGGLPVLTVVLIGANGMDRASQSMIVFTLAANLTLAMARLPGSRRGVDLRGKHAATSA
jgi:hypothetical protein